MSDVPSAALRMMRRLDELGRVSDEPAGLTRLYLSPAHARAIGLVTSWMEEAGLEVSVDDAGTVCGVMEGQIPGAPRVLLGSHVDTVRHAGKYDGCLGVAGAIAAVELLQESGARPGLGIEILAFGDEEGVRFPVTFTGSRAIAGSFDPGALDARDGAGVTLRQALRDFGLDPDGVGRLARAAASAIAYLEMHIEQGPVLEADDVPVGVVTSIAAAARFACDITGHAGHAGTVPMRLRSDAFAACAELAVAIRRIAQDSEGVVATIGRVTVPDGAVNVIPARTCFSLDVRAPGDAALATALGLIMQAIGKVAEAHGVRIAHQRTHASAATVCADWLQEALASAIARAGVKPHYLASGAGHDAAAMAALCPVGMLFVRCRGGISHHPDEHVSLQDASVAIEVLADTLRHLCAQEMSS